MAPADDDTLTQEQELEVLGGFQIFDEHEALFSLEDLEYISSVYQQPEPGEEE